MNAIRVGADAGSYIRVAVAGTCARGGIDLIAVERFVNGERLPLSRDEKVYAARVMHRRGLSLREIGRCLGVPRHIVTDWLKDGK